jgi:hypothetical protein
MRCHTVGVVVYALVVTLINGQLTGIFMIGPAGGAQLYDPFNTPHAIGNLNVGVNTSSNPGYTNSYTAVKHPTEPLVYIAGTNCESADVFEY